MSELRNRWLSVKRGWRIAIATILGLTLLLGGTWMFLYQRTALARDFDRTLMGVAMMANPQGQNALTDDQIRRVLVPLRNLEIQDSITREAASKTMADIRAILTPDQLSALDRAAGNAGSRLLTFGGGAGTGQSSAGTGTFPSGQSGFQPRARSANGLRARRTVGPLARLIAPLLTKLPQPAVVSQVCQRLEDRLNGVTPAGPGGQAPATTPPPDVTTPK